MKGTPAGMDIKLDISNAKNSTLNVLLPQSSQAVKYQGIVYINTPQDSLDVKKPVKKNENSFLMKLFSNLKVSDNLKLYVLLDPASGKFI